MSERFTFGPLGIYDTWHRCPADQREVCDLLNRQAEQLEVLREWIVHGDVNPYREDRIIKKPSGWLPERVELAKARIAAMENK